MSETQTLDKLVSGQEGVVRTVKSDEQLLFQRLLSMGIVTGTPVKVSRVAPLGDPIEIEARGYKLSLRKSEARIVQLA